MQHSGDMRTWMLIVLVLGVIALMTVLAYVTKGVPGEYTAVTTESGDAIIMAPGNLAAGLFVLFGVGVIISTVLVIVGLVGSVVGKFKGKKAAASKVGFSGLAMLTGFVLTYLICLVDVFRNPYWEDNGAIEEIEYPFHFGWAAFGASFLQVVVVPVTVALFYLVRGVLVRWKKRENSAA